MRTFYYGGETKGSSLKSRQKRRVSIVVNLTRVA